MEDNANIEYQHAKDVRKAMVIRQEIDDKISSLYSDRTINDCAKFVLPYITESTSLLDCGCGPGKLSVEFSKRMPAGKVVGIDANKDHLVMARRLAQEEKANNLVFMPGDLYQLPFLDNTFDIAFAHTVLCNIQNPIAALKEMRRVVKPGGLIAAREPDYFSSILYPEDARIDIGLIALSRVQTGYSDSTIGRKLRSYFNQAGIDSNQVSASCDTYSSEEQLSKISHYLKMQLTAPIVLESMLKKHYATKEQIQEFCIAMEELSLNPNAVYTYTLIEVVGQKEGFRGFAS